MGLLVVLFADGLPGELPPAGKAHGLGEAHQRRLGDVGLLRDLLYQKNQALLFISECGTIIL